MTGLILLALGSAGLVDRSDHVCILCLGIMQCVVELNMEMCINDVGSVIVHFLFEVGLEDDPFNLLSIVSKNIVVERHGKAVDELQVEYSK